MGHQLILCGANVLDQSQLPVYGFVVKHSTEHRNNLGRGFIWRFFFNCEQDVLSY